MPRGVLIDFIVQRAVASRRAALIRAKRISGFLLSKLAFESLYLCFLKKISHFIKIF